MRRFLKTTLKTILVAAGALFLFVAAIFAGIILIPRFEIGSSVLEKVLRLAGPAELRLQWRDAGLEILRDGWWGKEIRIRFAGACAVYGDEAVRFCAEEARWGVTVRFAKLKPRVTSFPPLVVTGATVAADLDRLPKSEAPPQEGGFSLVDFMRNTLLPKWRINGSLVEVTSVEVRRGEADYRGRVLLETAATFGRSPLSAQADRAVVSDVRESLPGAAAAGEKWPALAREGGEFLRLTVLDAFDRNTGYPRAGAQFQVLFPRDLEREWRAYGLARADLERDKSVEVAVSGAIKSWQELDFRIDTLFRGLAPLSEARFEGSYRRPRVDGFLSMKLGRPVDNVEALDFVRCAIGSDLEVKEGSLSCGPQTVDLALRERRELRNPQLFRLAPTFEIRLSRVEFGERLAGDWALRLDLRHLGFVDLQTALGGSFLREEGQAPRFSASGAASLAVTDFRRVVRMLATTPYSVPAPLNQLGGELVLSARGAVDENGGRVPFAVQPRLSSQYQRVVFDTSGELALARKDDGWWPELRASTLIEALWLSLPRVDLGRPPRLRPDPRFARAPEKKRAPASEPEPGRLAYDIRVRTRTPSSIRIATNLTKDAVPVHVDVRSHRAPGTEGEEGRTEGFVSVGRTALDLLKRDAWLERLRLDFGPKGPPKVAGRIAVNYVDYDVDVLLSGTTAEPQIQFESQPILPEDQIVSVLLFGRPMEELDEDQQSSVNNTNAAITDAVLGFSSLYLLASTPVESVGYDPERRMVSAKLALGEGTSLSLGQGSEGAGIGVRRRLGRNWVLNTYVEQLGQTDQRTVSAFVEWVQRF